MSNMEGKSVIVTGSSSGIGEATAILFAQKGANVTLCGRNTERLREAVKKCRQAAESAGHASSKFIEVAGDVTEPKVREEILQKTVQAFGRIDTLVANHGAVVEGDSHDDLREDAFDKIFDCNVKSVLFLIHKAIPYLEQTKGSVVVVSSFVSQSTTYSSPMYHMTKAAVDHMVRCLALEHGKRGVRVNAVNPTFVAQTSLFRNVMPNPTDLVPLTELFTKETPLQGVEQGPAEQAEAIVFLASDAARFISGQCLLVDGALLCKGNPMNFMS